MLGSAEANSPSEAIQYWLDEPSPPGLHGEMAASWETNAYYYAEVISDGYLKLHAFVPTPIRKRG